jgi:hypothetical protein
MFKSSRMWVLVGALAAFGVLVVVFILDAQAVKIPAPLPLVKTFDNSPTGFSLKYPEDWEYVFPTVGILIVGPPATLYNNEPGPTFTVQRLQPLSVFGTLDNALDQYLRNGPLRVSGRWEITQAVSPVLIEGREARIVELQGSDIEGGEPMYTRIIATSADNSFVYVFITLNPVDRQAIFASTLAAMLNTVEILE